MAEDCKLCELLEFCDKTKPEMVKSWFQYVIGHYLTSDQINLLLKEVQTQRFIEYK